MRAIARSKARPWASATAAVFLGLALSAPARGQAPEPEAPDEEAAAPLVERVEIARNQFLSAETLRFYVSTKPGDRYDQLRLREDFRRLWDTGFVDDLSIDVRDSPSGGKVVTFVVSERKRIQIVDFRGSKALTKTTIEDELKKKDAALKVDTFYDLGKARHVDQIPFGFTVNGKTLPPGAYDVDVDVSQGMVELRDPRHGAFALGVALDDPRTPETKLVFHRYGDQYELPAL